MFGLWENSHGHWFSKLESWGVRCERSTLSINEERLAYAYFEGPRAKACILLLHGTGNDALFGWDLWIEGFLQGGFAVLAIDLEGHGEHSSTQLDPETFTYSSGPVLSELSARGWNHDRLVVCGYSLGALFALQALATGSIRASRLILVAMPLEVRISWAFVWRELATVSRPIFWRHLLTQGWRMTLPALGCWRRQTFPLRLSNFNEKTYPKRVAALFQRASPMSLLSRLSLPCLLVHGSWDALAPPLPLADGDLRETLLVKGANHFLLPWYPEGLQGVIDWLERL